MEGESSLDRQADFASPSDQRRDARHRVGSTEQHSVTLIFGHFELKGVCVDYSPFGLGVRIPLSPSLPLLSIGELVELDCNFAGSRFKARGAIANTRIERIPEGDFVRLGVVLSRSAEVVRPAHVKRRSARIQMNESLAPLVCISDELLFGEPIFAKMTDVSFGGMRLMIDRHPLPFLEKQRHWFEIMLPAFGTCRVYCRLAYVRREEHSARYIVGCEFIDGGQEEKRSALEDWLFYCNLWLDLSDIRSAGFNLYHMTGSDSKNRVLLSALSYAAGPTENHAGPEQLQSSRKDFETLELTVGSGTDSLRMVISLCVREQLLLLDSIQSERMPIDGLCSVWKFLMIFALTHNIVDLDFAAGQKATPFAAASVRDSGQGNEALSLKVESLLNGKNLRRRIWRRVCGEMRKKEEFRLAEPPFSIWRLLGM
jgi:hypothetical protein